MERNIENMEARKLTDAELEKLLAANPEGLTVSTDEADEGTAEPTSEDNVPSELTNVNH